MILVDVDKEHIASISYGKDSLKMLEVIKSRGLPLDRITTTDVWATDTISARLPPMDSFVDRMDQWIWDHYRIEVEHLCAVNKDGTKKTYEQLFYHVPVRRSQIGNVEREREPVQPRRSQRVAGHRKTVVPERSQTICQNTAGRVRLPDFHRIPDTTGARSSNTPRHHHRLSRVGATLVPGEPQVQSAETTDFRRRYPPGAESSRSTRSRHLFSGALHEAQRYKCRGISGNCRG